MSHNTATDQPIQGNGAFTISLDFELMWGLFDKRSVESYAANIEGTRHAVERMLRLYTEFDVAVTWACVGLLLCRDKAEMLERVSASNLDRFRPDLVRYIESRVGENEKSDPYHFGSDIASLILRHERQELGSHSFSHYCVLEPYSNEDGFRSDATAMSRLFSDRDLQLRSYVFARNQIDDACIRILSKHGVNAFRGCPAHPFYADQRASNLTYLDRVKKLLDSYIKITDLGVPSLANQDGMTNTVASRFLRPWSPLVRLGHPLQLRRIKAEMRAAALSNSYYHLWWHPHNFGLETDRQIETLREILSYYSALRQEFGWCNLNMGELTEPLTPA